MILVCICLKNIKLFEFGKDFFHVITWHFYLYFFHIFKFWEGGGGVALLVREYGFISVVCKISFIMSFFSKEAVELYLRYFRRTNPVEISSTCPSFKFRVQEMPFLQKESGFSVYTNFNFKCE